MCMIVRPSPLTSFAWTCETRMEPAGCAQKNGDFPFYVLRETPQGLALMGRMFGSAYRSYIRKQHLEFRVEQHLAVNKTTKMRFRVEGDRLVDLSVPDLKWRASVANGIAKGD